MMLKTWKDNIEKIELSRVSENGILFIDASQLQMDLLPQLEKVFSQIIGILTQKLASETERLFADLQVYIKV